MPAHIKFAAVVNELGPAFLVALGVALVFTGAAAVVTQFHQVAAEDSNVHEVAAVAGPNATQVLNLNNWGVALTLPMGKGLPVMSWVDTGPDSIGLSAPAVEQPGAVCAARNNAMGALLRLPAGSFGAYPKNGQTEVFVATLSGHDYVYQMPKSTCAAGDVAANMTAQAEAAIEGAGVLTVTGQ